MNSQIERIRSRLIKLQPRKWGRRQQLRAASLEEVVDWERLHQITLPDAYRRFITEVADGVDAPFELYPLDQWWHHFDDDDDNPEMRRLWLSQPCLLRDDLAEDEDWLERIAGDKLQEDPEFVTWSPWAGTILLSHDGCGMLDLLIMNGRLRGRVCLIDFPHAPQFWPEANFLDWYEARLDEGVVFRR